MGPNGPKFPTTAQWEYPIELCNEMANCLAKFRVDATFELKVRGAL